MFYKSEIIFLLIFYALVNHILLCFGTSHFDPLVKSEFNFNNYYRYENVKTNLNNISNLSYRLPDTITPTEYHLKILPYFEDKDFIFIGETKIQFHVNNNTNKIILNSLNLNFNKSTVKIDKLIKSEITSENITITDIKSDATTEQVIITTGIILKATNTYSLAINYTGILFQNMKGFYRSWYINNGGVRWIGSTQMESPYARTVFPCFDEPRFRASFTLQIARYKDLKTISNMPLIKTTGPDPTIGDRVWDIYQKTPKMPTYLVAFCIFDFKSIKKEDITLWVQPDIADQGSYIIDKVQAILNIMGNFTSIKYNLPKMELVAVPDFSAGAMENWGLTTYREKYVLYKPELSTAIDKQQVLSVVAHEMSHQWFGNLVTPSWWNYLWLNEAFATYFQYYVPSIMEPTWRMMDQFVVRVLQYALSEDIDNGHPINANVSTTAEIEANFDVYEYSKGGSIVRMLKHIVGESNFENVLHQYLKDGQNKSEGVVTPQNLWKSFTDTLPKDVLPEYTTIDDIMNTWTNQKGYPLVTITRNYTDRTASITQKEFQSEGAVENSTLQWWIPLTLTSNDQQNFASNQSILWINPNTTTKILLKTDDWILLNIQQIGYYRVNYDLNNWNLLIDQLMKNHTMIHPINRAQIIDDAFSLAENGKIQYDIPITLVRYLTNEKDFIPWFSAIQAFKKILNNLYYTSAGSVLKAYIQNLIRPIYQSVILLQSQNTTHIDKLLINDVLLFACSINLNDCEKDLIAKFNDWLFKTPSSNLVPETKEAVLCTGVKLGTEQSWNDVWNYYKKSNVSSEKQLILRSLGCSVKSDVLYKYLKLMTVTQTPPLDIRPHDHKLVFYTVAIHPTNAGTASKFLTENYILLQNVTKVPIVKPLFGYLGSTIVKEEDYNELKQFYINNLQQLGELNATVNGTLNEIKKRIDWTKKYVNVIEQCLYAHTTVNTSPVPTSVSSPQTSKAVTTEPTYSTVTVKPTQSSAASLDAYCIINILIIILIGLNI